jgi:hypothetical protein
MKAFGFRRCYWQSLNCANLAYEERGQVYEQAERGARKGFLKAIFRLTQNDTVISCENFG